MTSDTIWLLLIKGFATTVCQKHSSAYWGFICGKMKHGETWWPYHFSNNKVIMTKACAVGTLLRLGNQATSFQPFNISLKGLGSMCQAEGYPFQQWTETSHEWKLMSRRMETNAPTFVQQNQSGTCSSIVLPRRPKDDVFTSIRNLKTRADDMRCGLY